jgi:hypothetical protein
MTTYEVLESGYIKKVEGDSISIIPNDLTNSDYQRYLNPEAEQSTPMVAPNE